ncbi:MerR family DNA-binding transcriptional regulator [Micromonospora sp. URMC 106]|uniref:MerR family DNA-binding transcriptional regulator n=1 Tax=Micromonospora sp. URMC 106 TaxID=3423408 RepID=UPI003F19FE48
MSRETGVAVRLLRYYEAQGLLTSDRSEGGHRHYAPEASAKRPRQSRGRSSSSPSTTSLWGRRRTPPPRRSTTALHLVPTWAPGFLQGVENLAM